MKTNGSNFDPHNYLHIHGCATQNGNAENTTDIHYPFLHHEDMDDNNGVFNCLDINFYNKVLK